MKLSIILKIAAVLLALMVARAPSAPAAAAIPPLESLNVSFWPEHDDPSVLVIYQGRLDRSVKLPATVRLLIPKKAKLSSTAAIDSNGQFQYEQTWQSHQVRDAGQDNELSFQTSSRDFQAELYYQGLSGNGRRDFKFDFTPASAVKSLRVEIEKPQRAEKFSIEPKPTAEEDVNGFKRHYFSFNDAAPGRKLLFNVSYDKADLQPSVGTKPGVAVGQGSGQRQGAVAAIALIVLVIGGLVVFWKIRSGRPAAARRPQPKKTGRKPASGTRYCSDCGTAAKKQARFCRVCGQAV